MRKSAFITIIFILLFFICAVYFNVQLNLKNQTGVLLKKLNFKEKELDQEKLRNQLALYQLKNFKEEVALVLGNWTQKKSLESETSLRTFASLVSEVDENQIEKQMRESLFYRAKEKYNRQEYSEGVPLLDEFIKNNPLSSHIVEAYYLLLESFYFLNQPEKCIEISQLMIQLFPENDFTGFAIWRIGKLYKEQKKIQQAIEVFGMIKMYFSNPQLNLLAERSLKDLI